MSGKLLVGVSGQVFCARLRAFGSGHLHVEGTSIRIKASEPRVQNALTLY